MQCFVTFSPYDPGGLGDAYPDEFVNAQLNHERVEFVRQTTGAPSTKSWRPGARVKGTTGIPMGAAIANFSSDSYLSHAAIYLGHDDAGIWVLDQWNTQGYVAKRQIKYPTRDARTPKPSNNGDIFYAFDPVRTNAAAKANDEELKGHFVATSVCNLRLPDSTNTPPP